MKHQLIHAGTCRCSRCHAAHPSAGASDIQCIAIGASLGLAVVAVLALANGWAAVAAALPL